MGIRRLAANRNKYIKNRKDKPCALSWSPYRGIYNVTVLIFYVQILLRKLAQYAKTRESGQSQANWLSSIANNNPVSYQLSLSPSLYFSCLSKYNLRPCFQSPLFFMVVITVKNKLWMVYPVEMFWLCELELYLLKIDKLICHVDFA